MAEAHSAVAFSFSITHEGWDINYDREVLNLVWDSGLRSWKKRLARFRVSILSLFIFISVLLFFSMTKTRSLYVKLHVSTSRSLICYDSACDIPN